jgi:hypothetical protein
MFQWAMDFFGGKQVPPQEALQSTYTSLGTIVVLDFGQKKEPYEPVGVGEPVPARDAKG